MNNQRQILVKYITRDCNCSQMFFQIGVLKNFATGKHDWKTPVFESLHLWNFQKHLFLQNTSCGCFCRGQLLFENDKTWSMVDQLVSWFFLYYDKCSTTPLTRTLKGPKKSVWLNGSLTYPNFIFSQTLLI